MLPETNTNPLASPRLNTINETANQIIVTLIKTKSGFRFGDFTKKETIIARCPKKKNKPINARLMVLKLPGSLNSLFVRKGK